MTSAPDRPTRFAADLFESAAVEGQRQSRSAKQQLDHWARVGRAVEMQGPASWRRTQSVPAATELSAQDALVANAEIDVAIWEQVQRVSFGSVLASEGVTTVALDETGALLRYHPDGSVSALNISVP